MSERTAQINEDRLKKFKNMGIPTPMEPVNPATMKNPNADPGKMKTLDAIRNGSKRGEFQSILEKTEPKQLFTPLKVAKQKTDPNAPKSDIPSAPIKSFSPDNSSSAEARMLDGAMYGEETSSTSDYGSEANHSDSRVLQEERVESDPYGSSFLSDFKSRARVAAGKTSGTGIQVAQQPRNPSPGISSEDLENKIMEIATSVSKTMIKKVISEYVKEGSGIIVETKNVKKAELVGNGKVKIGGKLYKLVPLKAKVSK